MQIVDSDGAAEHINVPLTMLAKLRQQRLIPCIRVGHRTVRYRVQDLDAYLARVRQPAVWEVSAKRPDSGTVLRTRGPAASRASSCGLTAEKQDALAASTAKTE